MFCFFVSQRDGIADFNVILLQQDDGNTDFTGTHFQLMPVFVQQQVIGIVLTDKADIQPAIRQIIGVAGGAGNRKRFPIYINHGNCLPVLYTGIACVKGVNICLIQLALVHLQKVGRFGCPIHSRQGGKQLGQHHAHRYGNGCGYSHKQQQCHIAPQVLF